MTNTRAKLFEGGDELDLAAFKPKTVPGPGAPSPDQVKAVSEAAEFRSREPARAALPAAAGAHRQPRTHRTGRNVQFNVKASQDVVDAFYRLSDRQGWVLGETLARALSALERDLADES